MIAQGNLNVDLRKKNYAMFVALTGTKPVPLNCVNSRSGPVDMEWQLSLGP